MIERSLVLIKSDGVERGISGELITRFEKAGFKIVGMKMIWADKSLAGKHYSQEIADKHGERVRNSLLKYLQSGPVIAIVLEGVEAISNIRKMVGSTYPSESMPGTIRGDYAHISKAYANTNERDVKNLIHASSNKQDAEKEIYLWFSDSELFEYETVFEKHIR